VKFVAENVIRDFDENFAKLLCILRCFSVYLCEYAQAYWFGFLVSVDARLYLSLLSHFPAFVLDYFLQFKQIGYNSFTGLTQLLNITGNFNK